LYFLAVRGSWTLKGKGAEEPGYWLQESHLRNEIKLNRITRVTTYSQTALLLMTYVAT
jgi:hypothetical protein